MPAGSHLTPCIPHVKIISLKYVWIFQPGFGFEPGQYMHVSVLSGTLFFSPHNCPQGQLCGFFVHHTALASTTGGTK